MWCSVACKNVAIVVSYFQENALVYQVYETCTEELSVTLQKTNLSFVDQLVQWGPYLSMEQNAEMLKLHGHKYMDTYTVHINC